MQVRVPSPLYSYTGGAAVIEGRGTTLLEILADLDARFPGLKFRIVDEQDIIRPHIRFFVGRTMATALTHPVNEGEEVLIVAALSGG
ncbi:MAG: MoaD/ThiS family protein [Cyanobacteria bacterium REEB65]|nr:MoaD/ThiS family protein [Cyanobacteria bacterium REEB65]